VGEAEGRVITGDSGRHGEEQRDCGARGARTDHCKSDLPDDERDRARDQAD
jgi:hypothetical protein